MRSSRRERALDSRPDDLSPETSGADRVPRLAAAQGALTPVAGRVGFEVRLANGERETADSLWGARHVIARRAAFDRDPLRPVNVLPAEIWKLDPAKFGGRAYVETIGTSAELTELGSGGA